MVETRQEHGNRWVEKCRVAGHTMLLNVKPAKLIQPI